MRDPTKGLGHSRSYFSFFLSPYGFVHAIVLGIAEAAKEAGLRGVLGETVLNFPAPDAKTPQDALAFTERFIRRFQNDPLIVPAVAPHALYTMYLNNCSSRTQCTQPVVPKSASTRADGKAKTP